MLNVIEGQPLSELDYDDALFGLMEIQEAQRMLIFFVFCFFFLPFL